MVAAAVARSAAMSRVDVACLDGRGLESRLKALEGERRRVEAELAAVISEVGRRGSYADDGHVSVKGWCRAFTRWSNGETATRARVARLLSASPLTATALFDGVLGVAQCGELARAFSNPRCGEQLLGVIKLLLRHAQNLSFEEFKVVVHRWESLTDGDGAFGDHQATHANRSASIHALDGVVYIDAHGATVQGAEMQEIFARYCDAEFRTDWDTVLAVHGVRARKELMPRTASQRGFDALHRIFVDAASTAADSQPPEPVLNLIVGLDVFETALARALTGDPAATVAEPVAWSPSDPRWWRCETGSGIAVPPAAAVAAGLVGHVRRVVIDSAGVVVDMGRKRRLFTGAARDAVLMMSMGCTWPGCSTTSGHCQADHTRDHQNGGHTSTPNGGPACPHHNRTKNRGYTVTRDTNGYWHTYRADGTEIA